MDPVSGKPKARNQLRWYLKRVRESPAHPTHTANTSAQGDNIDETKPVRLSWSINAPAEESTLAYPLKANIITCDDKDPPYRRTSSVRQGSEIKSKNGIDMSDLNTFKGLNGKRYKRIDFAIEMTVIGTALDFALVYQGNKIGHSQVEPELDHGY